jgi:hypothetical protein
MSKRWFWPGEVGREREFQAQRFAGMRTPGSCRWFGIPRAADAFRPKPSANFSGFLASNRPLRRRARDPMALSAGAEARQLGEGS